MARLSSGGRAGKGELRVRILLAVVLILCSAPAFALDPETTFRAEYRISFLGLRVASSSFTTRFSGDRFVLEGQIRSAGLARLFDRTTAETNVTGRLAGDGIEPLEYVLNYQHDGRHKQTILRFRDGSVAETRNDPPLKRRGDDWVALTPDHLKAVFDPITATMVRASRPRAVCDRTIRIYDGEIRVDLPLRYAGMKPFSTDGFKGDAVRCRADFRAVAGYRKGRRALDFLQRESRIEIAFASAGMDGVYAPVTATIDTEIGPVRLYATRFARIE